jgi:hypothetical protein
VLLLASPPALTLAQVRSSFIVDAGASDIEYAFSALADLRSHQRCVRTMDMSHSILVVLSRHPSRYDGVRIDRHANHKALTRVDSLPTTLYALCDKHWPLHYDNRPYHGSTCTPGLCPDTLLPDLNVKSPKNLIKMEDN